METTAEDLAVDVARAALEELLPALERLDALLAGAVSAAQAAYGPQAAADRFRGLHIGPEEAARLLARPPGLSPLAAEAPVSAAPAGRLAWLAQTFGLGPFELDVVLIALAPLLEPRYERLYAYLQDDIARRRPTVDLALNLLCPSAPEKLARRVHFAPGAPLLRHALVSLGAEAARGDTALLAQTIRLDDQIADVLLGQSGLDRRLGGCCRLLAPSAPLSAAPLPPERLRGLLALVAQAGALGRPLRLVFQGQPGAGRRLTAEALACAAGAAMLVADLGRVLAAPQPEQTLRLIFREAWLQGALLYLEGAERLDPEREAPLLDELLAESAGVCVVACGERWAGGRASGALSVAFGVPEAAQRRACWERHLAEQGVALDGAALDVLAARFRLGPGQIAAAAALAPGYVGMRLAAGQADLPLPFDDRPALEDLFAAARAQSGRQLAALARRITPACRWDEIVLPDDVLAQLREICAQAGGRERVLGAWGFGRKLPRGTGVCALFAGPSGTGKTMAAELIAGELGLDLYAIDLASVVSKYIGETEKNLDRIFRAAEDANAVLLFDEADALFGKRSEVKDAHDRYANLEISYLLQKVEQYEGVAILATNLRQHLDEAFLRRLAFIVSFPFPEEPDRRRIWEKIWPAETPLDPDVRLDRLAGQFRLSGGNIKNVALAAAYLAASNGGVVTAEHLRHAVRREFQKLGKTLSAEELASL
jgi:AAA+ superfamily predicted ATPase